MAWPSVRSIRAGASLLFPSDVKTILPAKGQRDRIVSSLCQNDGFFDPSERKKFIGLLQIVAENRAVDTSREFPCPCFHRDGQ